MQSLWSRRQTSWLGLMSVFSMASNTASAQTSSPLPGTINKRSKFPFNMLLERLERAVQSNQMGVVAQASASRGAAARGITIPGNAVVMVFRNDFAVRMLRASIPAGIEAPLRFYLTEEHDGTAVLTYRTPSSVFAPYKNSDLDAMARELDAIFEKIAQEAAGG
jgi:uncharacterized protein (DUF302 family)